MKIKIGNEYYILQRSAKGKLYLRRYNPNPSINQVKWRVLFSKITKSIKGKKWRGIYDMPIAAIVVKEKLKGKRVGRVERLTALEKRELLKKYLRLKLIQKIKELLAKAE